MIEEVVLYILSFLGVCAIQSLAINGIHESMKGNVLKDDMNKTQSYQGQIIYMMFPGFFERNKYKYWAKPVFSCVKCMSSLYGGLIFWPVVIYLWGFRVEEVFVFVVNVLVLVPLNWIIYKKL